MASIVDLSSPEGKSVNDGISEELSYVSVDNVVQAVLHKGRRAQLDIRSAYRIVPVHPEDRWLLGMMWEGVGRGAVHRHSTTLWLKMWQMLWSGL